MTDEDRLFLEVMAPHFHICSGERPGGCFLQREAWQAREMVMDSVAQHVSMVRAIRREGEA